MQNGLVESCNGRIREECLDEHLFLSLRHAVVHCLSDQWRPNGQP